MLPQCVGPRMLTLGAGTTPSSASWGDVGIGCVELMAAFAMRLGRLPYGRHHGSQTTSYILAGRNRFQMIWINAATVATKVIVLKPRWRLAYKIVVNSVRLPVVVKDAVASVRNIATPNHASVCPTRIGARPEANYRAVSEDRVILDLHLEASLSGVMRTEGATSRPLNYTRSKAMR